MAKERLKSPRLRLFIALEPPEDARALLAGWQRELVAAGSGELRAAAPESLHVTFAFIGYRPERDVERLSGALQSVPPRPVAMDFERTLVAKPVRRPRLYAVPLVAGSAFLALRNELVASLTRDSGFEDERREFWPHITLCRVKSSAKGHEALTDPPRGPDQLAGATHPAVALTLFSSDLQPSGAVYTPLATVALPAAPQ
ncbi:MAG: RNA 2',3'-cyclic phosphodiesterase [Solirubrobacterales bacterium]